MAGAGPDCPDMSGPRCGEDPASHRFCPGSSGSVRSCPPNVKGDRGGFLPGQAELSSLRLDGSLAEGDRGPPGQNRRAPGPSGRSVGQRLWPLPPPLVHAVDCQPGSAPPGDLELDPDGPGYFGSLRRADSGEPLGDVRVNAWCPGVPYGWHSMSAVTDGQGLFQVSGRSVPEWTLTFEAQGDRSGLWTESAAFAGLTFRPQPPPGTPPTVIDVRLPVRRYSGEGGLKTVRVQGRVLDPVGDGLVQQVVLFTCLAAQTDGELVVDYGSAQCTTGAEGRFSVDLPATDRIEARVVDAQHRDLLRETWDVATLTDGGERLLRVP